MNVALNVVIGAALMAGVYLAMIAGGAHHDLAASTAILVGATGGLQTLRSDALASRLAKGRQRAFERRLDTARVHVIAIVHAHLADILPDVEKAEEEVRKDV